MDFKTRISAEIEVDGFACQFTMPAGCSFRAAHTAATEIAKNIEIWAKQAEEAEKAKAEAAAAVEPDMQSDKKE